MLRLPLSALPLTVSISAGCLALVLFASLFHHQSVVSFGEDVAMKAKLSFEEVMRQRLEYGNLHHHHHSSDNDSDLEPEWEWARDVSIVYTVSNLSSYCYIIYLNTDAQHVYTR